ncbi:hypothetical protein IFM89_000731 [Coptis chinensis]|uniref:Reverse transcriptase zinc-binding domain-containing protein n=1 Tax=Coptis chinensis TaxID=261450 RepID=A0A835MB90_9MAGN|nr:hypothetical protein IFM89_000731 [Coptis chinensis]
MLRIGSLSMDLEEERRSCWAFSAVAPMEGATQLKTGEVDLLIQTGIGGFKTLKAWTKNLKLATSGSSGEKKASGSSKVKEVIAVKQGCAAAAKGMIPITIGNEVNLPGVTQELNKVSNLTNQGANSSGDTTGLSSKGSSVPVFSFSQAGSTTSSASLPSQPVFGTPNPAVPFGSNLQSTNQMNMEDSMAEDTVQASNPALPKNFFSSGKHNVIAAENKHAVPGDWNPLRSAEQADNRQKMLGKAAGGFPFPQPIRNCQPYLDMSSLQSELDRILYLLKIADPTGEAAKKRYLNIKTSVLNEVEVATSGITKLFPRERNKKSGSGKLTDDSTRQEGTHEGTTQAVTVAEVENNVTDSTERKGPAYTAENLNGSGISMTLRRKKSNKKQRLRMWTIQISLWTTKTGRMLWVLPSLYKWNQGLKLQLLVYEIRFKRPKVHWSKHVWNSYIHPKHAGKVWKLCSKATATYENIKKRGVTIASKCRHCGAQEEFLIHLLWECVFAKEMWNWLAKKFKFRGTFSNMKEAIKLSKNSSPRVVHLWTTAVFGGMIGLWKHRNKVFFQDKAVSKAFCEGMVRSHIITTSYLSKGHTMREF